MSLKIFLTGGAGFIGSHLTEALLNAGHSVTCLDDLSTGSETNVARFLTHPRYAFKRGKVEDAAVTAALIKKADVTYHLAATVGVKNVVKDPIQTIENNILGTSVVLRAADEFAKRVFIFSTSEVYGKSERFPFGEADDLVMGCSKKPRWSYACSKLIDEFLADAYYRRGNASVTTVRLFNTIGRGQVSHYGMVVPRFFQQALANEKITIYGSGQQSRCFTDVRDVTEALMELITIKASFGEIVNIGNPFEITIADLARKVKALTASASALEYISFDQVYGSDFEDMKRRVPCVDKIRVLLGRHFKRSLDETLAWIHAGLVEELPRGAAKPLDALTP